MLPSCTTTKRFTILSTQFGHREAHVHEFEPPLGPDHLFAYGLFAFRWCVECRYYRVPDEFGALPAYPLHAFELRADHLCRESVSRTALGCRDYDVRLRARLYVREV